MLKGNFIKKSFSVKNRFLDKSLLGPLESQSHLLEVGELLGTRTGLPPRGLAAARAHSREESYGRRWAWVSSAGEAAVAAAVAGACAPHGCFCNTVGSSVAQLGRSKHNGGGKG